MNIDFFGKMVLVDVYGVDMLVNKKWKFAAIDADGDIHFYDKRPVFDSLWWVSNGIKTEFKYIGKISEWQGVNWKDTLIKLIPREELEVEL